MQPLFADMFSYHHHFNQKTIDLLEQRAAALPENSWPLFCHIVNAHNIWNSRMLAIAPATGVQSVHSYDECRKMDTENYQNSLALLETADFATLLTYTNSRGEQYTNTVGDIAFHVVNHTTHHRGQIMAQLRQAGIAPPPTDYIFYKR